jgi:hypothetical protein
MILPTLNEGDQVQLFIDGGPELQLTLAGKVGELAEFTMELLPLTTEEVEAFGEEASEKIASVAITFPTYLPINSVILLSILKRA